MAKYDPDEFFKAERYTGFLNPPSSYKNVVTVEGNCVDAHCTNADRIRAMSDEELAEEYAKRTWRACPPLDNGCQGGLGYGCTKCWLDWLKSPAEGAE